MSEGPQEARDSCKYKKYRLMIDTTMYAIKGRPMLLNRGKIVSLIDKDVSGKEKADFT